MQPLPIDPLLPAVLRALGEARAVVIEAEPGAGKTTRVPPALLDSGLLGAGEVLVSEPRRLAARLAARRVAAERGEPVGQSVGYSVRFEDVSSRDTRIRFVTEGVLVRRLLADPELSGVSAVVLDELHERSLATDLALALLSRLRATARPDLFLAVMSATLDAEPVSMFLGGCPRLSSEGRVFPIEIEHLAAVDDRPLEKQVVSAVRTLAGDGDVLVFLPGAAEIRRSLAALEPLAEAEDLLVLPLHGDLSIDAQARAVEPADRRKVILSTNVAESSVTIDGVTAVVDSGLARVATHSPWSGLPRLDTGKVSRAAATQRAGRAGRTRPGRVMRLYTRGDLATRAEHDAPEIERADLSEMLLVLHGSGVVDAGESGVAHATTGRSVERRGDAASRFGRSRPKPPHHDGRSSDAAVPLASAPRKTGDGGRGARRGKARSAGSSAALGARHPRRGAHRLRLRPQRGRSARSVGRTGAHGSLRRSG